MFLLCDAFFLLVVWALDPLGNIVVVFNMGFGVNFTSTLFKSSLAQSGMRGDEDDEGGYDINEDTLDLI